MSAPRGKSLNKLNVSGGIKNLQVKDEIAHIPPTLYKFPSNKSASGFPMLPSRQNVNDVSISLGPQIREASADTFTPKTYLSEMLKPDIFSKSMKANKILKSDKEHSKIDFSKKANDVSYLMETRTYMKEQKLNDHSANLVKRSLDLLSPKHQVNFGEYSILASPQYREEKPGSRKEKANIYLEMKEYGKEEPALSEALTKFKLPYQAEESPERKPNVNRSIDMENGNGSFSRTLPKIVDSSKLGSTIDLPDSPNRDELKDTFMMRMRKGTIVQKRSQNKNLTVPSGRKEVVSLSDWLANMLEDVQRNKFLGLPEILDQTQLVYTVCLEEIIRQVKIQCSERGQILEKIWEAYMNLFNRAMDISYKEKKHLENLHNEEMSRIKFLYEKDIEHQLHKIKETQEELDKQNALLEKEIERRTFLESKTERLTKDVFSLKHELHKAQTEMQSLINNPKYEADVNAKKNLTSIQLHKQSKSKKNTSQGKAFSNEASFTEEDSLQEQSSQSNLEEKTEDLRDEQQPFEERWKEAETDTNDLDKFIDNNQLIQKEMLDKSVQYDNENNDEDENEEIEDTDKIKEEGSSDEESEEDIQAVHSAQEMIEVQNLEEMQTVKEALDQLAVVELYELEKEIQSRIAQFEEPGESKKRHKKTRSVSFAKEKALKKSSLKKKKNKGEQIASENSSVVVDKGTTKEDVIEVLEKYQENQLYPSLKDIPTEDQMIEFMLQFLKGDEKWKMQDFQYLVKKITKRKAHSLDLDQEISKEDIGASSKLKSLNGDQLSQTIKSMEKEDLVGIIAELERKLEEIIKGNEQGANNQEIVEMLKIIFEEREELMDGKYRPLFKKILQAYEQSANQNMELKIQNKEQDVDLKEFENEREKQENRTRDLYRQINDWQEKNQDLQKMNKKLQKTLVRQKTFTKEINSKKIEKLGSLINGYISGPGIDSKDSRDEYDDTTERERTNPIKEPSVENTSTEEQSPLKAVTMNIIDNIAEIMKMPGSDLEEEWSESDDNTGKSEKNYDKEERKNIQRSSSRTLSVFASRKNRNTVILTRPIDGLKSKRIVRVTNINGESANALLAKAKQKKNIKSALTKPSLLKFMSQFYIEKIKDIKKSPQTPLHVSVYEYFMNKYGLKKVAETKCLQIYEAAIAFAGTKKIHRFRELLGLGESFEVVEELDLYLSTFRQLDISGNGVSIASNTQEKIFIGLDQAEAATIGLFEKKLDTQSLKESLASLYKLNSVDRASRLVELEDVVDKFIYIQRNLQDTVKGFVKEIFGATDLDNDETIEFFEFNILYKHVEKERYDKNQVKDMFFEHADLILSDGSNEPVLSFNKFAWICLEMKLFSEERQKLFARVPNSADRVQTVHDLEQGLKEKLNEIRLRFMKSQTYTSQVKNIMMKLFSSVRNPQKSRNVVWLSYRLLDEESKSQLLDYEIRMMLPDEFRIIQKFVDEMEGWDDNNY